MDLFPTPSLPDLFKTGTFVAIILLWLRFIGVPWSHIGRICLFCLIFMNLLVMCCPL
jgi:hypothetical protein